VKGWCDILDKAELRESLKKMKTGENGKAFPRRFYFFIFYKTHVLEIFFKTEYVLDEKLIAE